MVGRIGKYNVEKELGQGGFGKVYLAFDPDVGQPVAIKKLLTEGDADLLRRFQMEIRTTAGLRHKNIVTIYASGEEDGHPYLVMEFLEGRTLKQIIQERSPLSVLEKVRIMTQVAEGLAYAHAKGVVHRDVKPENIMLLPDDNVKIMDFGIALGPNRNSMATQTGGIIGTPAYFAPEQLEGYKANEQSDIFSYGDVFYELLTWVHPFEQYKNDWKSLQIAIMSYEPRSLGELLSGCPEALETLVHRTLAKEPAFRYQKFEEIQLDGEAILVDLRHEGAADILREVTPLIGSGNLQTALNKIQQAYKLEPGNREVRRLREEINQRIQREQVQTRVAGLLAEAESHMRERRYAEALQNLEACARLDSTNAVVGPRLQEAKARVEASVRANRLVSEARFQQQKGLLTEARQRLDEALALDPDHTDARRLNQRIADELDRRRGEQQRQQAIRTARDHVAGKRFAEALAILDEIEKAMPGAGGVPELRADIQHEQAEEDRRVRAEKFNLALARTREAMQQTDLERANQMVEYLCANFADAPGAADVLPGLRERMASLIRAKETAQAQQKIRALLKEKSFPEALGLLAEALRKFPGDAGLERLSKSAEDLYRAHQRAEAIAAVLKQATSRRDRGDVQGALDAILEGRKNLGEEAAFADLALQLEMEIEQQRYSTALEGLLKGCSELMAAGNYSEAIDRLEKAREFGGEAEVRTLLDSARAAAAIQQERAYVEKTLAMVEKLQSAAAWKEALGALERGLSRYPHNSSLAQTADRLRDRVEMERVRLAIENQRALIQREIDAGRWKAAADALGRARAEFPGDRAFDDLAERVDGGMYEEGWRAVEMRVNQALGANAFSQAQGNLDNQDTRTIYANDPRWKALQREIAQRREYEEALAEAERRRKAGSLSEAEEILTQIINQGPRDKRAQQLRGAIQSQHSEAVRQQEIARITQGIRDHLSREDLSRAASELSSARTRYPGENIWAELQAGLDGRRESARRQGDIAAAEEAVRQALSRDDISQAAAGWAAARSKYPGEAIWSTLEAEIGARQAAVNRRTEIAAAEAAARQSLGRDDIGQALAKVTAARSRYPGEAVWTTLEAEIGARQEALNREHEIAALAESVRRRLDRGHPGHGVGAASLLSRWAEDLAPARAELEAARARYPGEHVWDTLQAEIDARRALLDAERAISGRVIKCLEQGEASQAETLLATARAQCPDEVFWGLFLAEIKDRLELLKLRAAVARIEESVRDRLRRNDPQGARTELAAGRAKYPSEPVWTALETEIEARLAAIQRETEKAEVARIERSVRDRLQRNDPQGARTELAAGLARYPAEPVWTALESEIEARLAAIQRETEKAEVARIEQGVRDRLQRNDPQGARTELAAGRAKYPAEPVWTALETELEARLAAIQRAEVARIEQSVRDRLQRNDPQGARTELAPGRAKYPAEPVWTALETELEARLAAIQRAEVARIEQSVRDRLQRNDPQGARTELAAGRAKYPAEAVWTALETEIEARLAAVQLEAAKAEVAASVRRSLDEGISKAFQAEPDAPVPYPIVPLWEALEKTCSRLDEARKKYPGEALWQTVQAETDARRSQLESEIRESVRNCLSLDPLDWYARAAETARARYPGDSFLEALQAELNARREPLQRLSLAEFEGRVREALKQGDLAAAQARFTAAQSKHPRAPVWAQLQAEIDARQAAIARQTEVTAAGERVRASLQRDELRQAAADLNAARAKYPGEALWTTLQAAIDARLAEIEEARGRAETLLEQGRPADAVALIESRFAQHPRFTDLLTRAHQALDLQKRREARDRDCGRLSAIQGQMAGELRARKRKELDREAQSVAAGYPGDPEILALASSIHSQVEVQTAPAQPGTPKEIPWKPIGGAAVAVALAAIVFVWLHKRPVPAPPTAPATATIPVEIRTDPAGASLTVGGHSCFTPNCRLDLAPGSYRAEAQLQGYEPKQQTVVFDSSHRTVEMTLQPLPAPPAASQSTGTLVVRTTPPDVVVLVDGSPRSRTDQFGSVTLTLEAKIHDVKVERNGYDAPPAKKVKVTAGAGRTEAFTLTPQKGELELDGAPANLELVADGKPLGRTDQSSLYVFPARVEPGNHILSVGQGSLLDPQGQAGKNLTVHFEPGQRVRLSWKADPVAPTPVPPAPTPTPPVVKTAPPTPEDTEERDWQQISGTSEPEKVREFRKRHPNGKHAADAEQLLDRLAWSSTKQDSLESLRAYVHDFPNGLHHAEATAQIDELTWKNVDTSRIDQVRKYFAESPRGSHAAEAQKIIDRQDLLQDQVRDVLNGLNAAFDKKQEPQIKQIWPKVSREWLDSLRRPDQKMSLKAQADPQVQGDSATVRCTLHTTQPSPKDQNATLSLHYAGGRWQIADLKVTQ